MNEDKEKKDHFKEDQKNYYSMPCIACVHVQKDVKDKDCPCENCVHYA